MPPAIPTGLQNKVAVLLAGGRSRRFGSNKAFAKIGYQTFLEKMIETLTLLDFEICLSVSNLKTYAHLPYKMILDVLPQEGPLQALYSALMELKNSKILLLGCDMPLVSKEIISLLWDESHDADICFLGEGQDCYPVPAVYSEVVTPYIKNFLDSGKRNLKALLQTDLKMKRIGSEVWHPLDLQGKSLFNINTQDDLTSALSIKHGN